MIKISERIVYVGVTDLHTRKFEGMWPLPYGVTYNSYVIADEKVALIDTVEGDYAEEYLAKVEEALSGRSLDYLVVNHMEPDHSSLIADILDRYPQAKILTTAKAVPMIQGYHGIGADSIHVVKEAEEVSLGSCTLRFHAVPMVHWPETMVTWVEQENTLFSGDAFGTFGAVDCQDWSLGGGHLHGGSAAESCFEEFKDEMTRYYSNIVGKYGAPVQAALKKLGSLAIKRICSTHGPVWTSDIPHVVSLYDRLSRYESERGVCIAYGTMYGNTRNAAFALAAELDKLGIPYGIHDLSRGDDHASDLGLSGAIRDLFKYDTVAVGSPTYNAGVFPPVQSFMEAVAARGVKGKRFFSFGSYTWAPASTKLLDEMAVNCGQTLLDDKPGIAFPQAFSPEKCNMAAIAARIAE